MGLVQIEQSELDTLRRERDDARTEAAQAKENATTAERERDAHASKVEEVEAAKVKAEQERDEVKANLQKAEEEKAQAELAGERMKGLGSGFVAKLGDFTKGRLEEQAKILSDSDWDHRLRELEEVAQVKRDAAKDGSPAPKGDGLLGDAPEFQPAELATLGSILGEETASQGGTAVTDEARSSVVGSLASAFSSKK